MDLLTRRTAVGPSGAAVRAVIGDAELVARHLSGAPTDAAQLGVALERLGVGGCWCGNHAAIAAGRALPKE